MKRLLSLLLVSVLLLSGCAYFVPDTSLDPSESKPEGSDAANRTDSTQSTLKIPDQTDGSDTADASDATSSELLWGEEVGGKILFEHSNLSVTVSKDWPAAAPKDYTATPHEEDDLPEFLSLGTAENESFFFDIVNLMNDGMQDGEQDALLEATLEYVIDFYADKGLSLTVSKKFSTEIAGIKCSAAEYSCKGTNLTFITAVGMFTTPKSTEAIVVTASSKDRQKITAGFKMINQLK